jgi:PAS domain S-box-containing protein
MNETYWTGLKTKVMKAEPFRNRRWKLSMKSNLLLSSVLCVFLIAGSFIIVEFVSMMLVKEAVRRADETADFFSKINSVPLQRMDYYAIETNKNELMKNEDIVFADVYDADNFQIATFSKKESRQYENSLEATLPILNADNRKIGYVRVGLSLQRTDQIISKTIFILAGIMLVVLLVIIMTQRAIIKRIIIKPINHLLDSVNVISSGDLDQEVRIMADDEIGELSDNFNTMTQKLKSSLSFINNIIESMPSMVIALDENGRVTQWNRAAVLATGLGASDVLSRKITDVTDVFRPYLDQYEKASNPMNPAFFYRQELGKGVQGLKNLALYPLISNGIRGVVLKVDDITELEKKEIQLRQMQKMEMVGTLAGGLAHDFNNVLGGIVGTLSLVKIKIQNGQDISVDSIKSYLTTMEESSERASNMVQQLLSLSRQQEFSFTRFDLNLGIRNVVNICQNTFDKCVEIRVHYADKEAWILADQTQMEQIILNLCINAYHSMTIMRGKHEPVGGELVISVDKIAVSPQFAVYHPEAEAGFYWNLSVMDTGIGMDGKTMSKIFDPFFTTKEKGRGTGLGLAMVYNLVQQHKGFIDVNSELGVGSRFNVYVPEYKQQDGTGKEGMPEPDSAVRGEGLVLVVDDEEVIRNIARTMLEESGYSVMTASDGEEAIQLYAEHHRKIAAVLLDTVMPKKSGEETFLDMIKINPEVKVLLASGFNLDDRVAAIMSRGVKGFIQKPYKVEKLSRIIHEILFDP